MKNILLIIAVLFICSKSVVAEVSSEILVQGSSSWDGKNFQYPDGEAKLVVQKIEIKSSNKEISLAMHCHNMPLAAYVLKGNVKVVKSNGESQQFDTGDAFIEVMNQWHKGVFVEDTQLIVFYASNKSLPLSLKLEGSKSLPKNSAGTCV